MKLCGDPWTASGMQEKNAPHEAPVRAFLTRLVHDEKAHARFLNMLSMLEHMGSRKIMVSQMNKGDTLSQDTLQHLSEEARHAYFFKRHAERVNGVEMPGWVDDNTMCRVPALMYFGRMDAGISKTLEARQRLHQQKCHPEQSGALRRDVEGFHAVKTESHSVSSPRKRGSSDAEKDPRFHGGSEEVDATFDPYGWVSLIIELRACWLYRIYDEVVDEEGVHLPLKGLIAEEDGHLEEMFGMCGENHDLLKELSAYETTLFEKLWTALEDTYAEDMDKREAA